MVDGAARDQRPRQLAAIPSSALAQLTTTRARASEFWGCPTPLRPNDHPDLKMANASCSDPCIGYAPHSCASRRIIDGDTLAIGSTKIRLEGIDAPETDQFCLNVGGVRWTCGIAGSSRAGGSPRRSTDQLQSQAVSTPTSERSPPASSRAAGSGRLRLQVRNSGRAQTNPGQWSRGFEGFSQFREDLNVGLRKQIAGA